MRTIKVNWAYVETAFERNSPDLHSYIDRDSGDVLVVVDGLPEDDESRRRIAANPERFVKLEPASSREQYRWMERFVSSLEDPELRERLMVAIDGKGAFRRFKDVLLSFPQDRERWFNYRALLLHYHINQWFETKALEPDPPPPWGKVAPPPENPEQVKPQLVGCDGITEVLRKQVKNLVDALPPSELHAAKTFLEYLRDRGAASGRTADDAAEDLDESAEDDLLSDDSLDHDEEEGGAVITELVR